MSNSFYIEKQNLEFIINNGLTDVLFNTLVLAGSRLAQTANEKTILAFIAEQDQSIYGRGCVGFDLGEIPFTIDGFQKEKKFLLKVCEGASMKFGWEILQYEPNEELAQYAINEFGNLIEKMTIEDLDRNKISEWYKFPESKYILDREFEYCKKHQTILTCYGCMICNEENT